MKVYICGRGGVIGIEAVYGVARSLEGAQKLAAREAKREGWKRSGEWSGGRKKGWGCPVDDGICMPGLMSLWVSEKVLR